MQLSVGHLFPDLMNIYADRGNVECLIRRSEWRGIQVAIHQINNEADLDGLHVDLLIVGGGQDRQQLEASNALQGAVGNFVRHACENGVVMLAVCGGFQLMGMRYVDADGLEISGLGIFDMETIHPGRQSRRAVGNIVVELEKGKLVGYENHGGQTYLGASVDPLGKVLVGSGNNFVDNTEGAKLEVAYGTYLHGSLLPKNPHFADHLINLACQRYEPGFELSELDDELEWCAHHEALKISGCTD
tara:strand:+ start:1238 stop:1972 length:735 start_codon:yes stop_codon:yes gene_type:complete